MPHTGTSFKTAMFGVVTLIFYAEIPFLAVDTNLIGNKIGTGTMVAICIIVVETG
ncbi:protein of unknown function [Paenibacillus alvei]|uniref:Uncharacterized protein n=1 Tax=Paenibacillus alvei TaxID=44250 RepID=A0A383RFZ0_PAEAL|nr:protein of unknown function [Paenibacillus alvei]